MALRRTLQLEGISSLKLAVERSKAIEIIRGDSFERGRKFGGDFKKSFERKERKDARKGEEIEETEKEKGNNRRKENWRGNKSAANPRECWTCGKIGHFRSECPEEKGNAIYIVELSGAGSANKNKGPIFKRFINSDFYDRYIIKNFCYQGKIDGRDCFFKIDTGSDISILSSKLVRADKERILINDYNLRYPTGEKVPVEFGVEAKVQIGKYSVEVPMFVAEINDECLLGLDFLKMINLENVFGFAFGNSKFKEVVALLPSQ